MSSIVISDSNMHNFEYAIREIRRVVEQHGGLIVQSNPRTDLRVSENRNFKPKSGVFASSAKIITNEFFKLDREVQCLLSYFFNKGNLSACQSLLVPIGNFYPNTVKAFLSLVNKGYKNETYIRLHGHG